MKIWSYVLYGLWVITAIVLKIIGLVSWWVATSWIWFPFAMILCFFAGINISVIIGKRIKEKENAKIPDSCEVCLFGQSMKYAENGKCLGVTLDENHEFGKLCPQYKRHISK